MFRLTAANMPCNLPMTEDRWKSVYSIFEKVSSVPEAEQASFLASLNTDPVIASQVAILLRQSNSTAVSSDALFAPMITPGQQIGRYQVQAPLGQGGMGELWSARDLELDRLIALKFLRRATPADSAEDEHIVREAKAAAVLHHPNLITIFEVVRFGSIMALAMELVEGELLRELCGTPQAISRVVAIGAQMAEGLSALHSASMLHRDIKPENVIIRKDGYLKILDFGLARPLDRAQSTAPSLPAGTFRYMSPEQSLGRKLTAASDVYSMGIVLYELAAGSHPFPAETPVASMLAASLVDPRPLAEVNATLPRRFAALVDQMISREPRDRPTAAQAAEILAALRSELSRSSDEMAVIREPVSSGRRNFLYSATAAGVVSAVGWYGWRRSNLRSVQTWEAAPFGTDPGQASEPALSPDGRTVAYVSHQISVDSSLRVKTVAGAPVTLAPGPLAKGSATWSPDGKSLAYLEMIGTKRAEIRIVPASGGASRKVAEVLTPHAGHTWFPGPSLRWSPHLPGLRSRLASRRAIPSASFLSMSKQENCGSSPPQQELRRATMACRFPPVAG